MKRKLEDLGVDDFFRTVGKSDESSEEEDEVDDEPKPANKLKKAKSLPSKKHTKAITKPSIPKKDEVEEHKQALENLKKTDPTFYKYLKENDKNLLEFGEQDESSSDDESDNGVHHPPEKLEVASDESDVDEDETIKPDRVTHAQIKKWKEQLKETKPIQTLREVSRALSAAVQQVEGSEADGSDMKVLGSTMFNSILRLCITDFIPTVNRLLRAPKSQSATFKPKSAKLWKKVLVPVKSYLVSSIKILSAVAEPAIVRVLLKHALTLVNYYSVFPNLSKALLKKLVTFWCTGEESVRVLAFMVIVRVAKDSDEEVLQKVLKEMYMAYVKNCKFTSPSTWPLINFMKHSLVEIFALNQGLAYKLAFVYIRQLAIHLRNAITIKKKDSIKTIYNWQFMHCLYLWSQMLSTIYPSDILQPLIYPLVQIVLGATKLVPTAKYIPLRFHCARVLTHLTRETGVFVPVMPLILETLDFVDFNKKHSRVSWKPMDFLCALKASKSQLQENGFKDAVIDNYYELTVDYLYTQCHTIGFPELILPAAIQMKGFLKKCKVANYNKQVKQLMEKMEENAKTIDDMRKTASFILADNNAVTMWENECKQSGKLPLAVYYETYRKLRDRELKMTITKKDQLDDSTKLHPIKRQELMEKHKEKDREEYSKLFGDDEEEDDDDLTLQLKTGDDSEDEDVEKDNDDSDASLGESSADDDLDDDEPPTKGKNSNVKKAPTKQPTKTKNDLKIKETRTKVASMDKMDDVVEELRLSSSEDEEDDDQESDESDSDEESD